MTAARTRRKPALRPAPQADLPLQPRVGVHLNMPEEVYFGAHALGSSDFATLASDPASWWYASAWNTHRRERRKRHAQLAFGAALHALILEGEDAYRSRFTLEPDPADARWLKDPMEVRKALLDRGVAEARTVFDPGALSVLARKHGISDRVWDLAWSHYESAKRQGRRHITEDEDRRLRHMAKLVSEHPDLGPGLRLGLPEVSVFWRRLEDPDTMLRVRMDRVAPAFITDLKSVGNWRGKSVEEAAIDAIAEHDYDVQASHYCEGRRQAAEFIRSGQVYAWAEDGGDARVLAAEKVALNAIAAATAWRWIWIFYQVRNDNAGQERAPVLVPRWIDPTDPMLDAAGQVIEDALTNFQKFRAEFGMTQPWTVIEKIKPLPSKKLKRLAWKRTPQ